MTKYVSMFVLAASACTSLSPLQESQPQVELTANPGAVAGKPRFELTLTTWNNLASLGDATESGQITTSLDDNALVIDPIATGYFGEHDSYIAAFEIADSATLIAKPNTSTSLVTVSDGETTWSVHIPDLMTNDLAPDAPVVANQPVTLTWPSAATTDPWSTISWACADVSRRAAACTSDEAQDPGIDVTAEIVHVDLPAVRGDTFVIWGQRWANPVAAGDGPTFAISILNQVKGTFE